MSEKPFDKTTQKTLALVAGGLAIVLIYAAASEAGWIGTPEAEITVTKTSDQ